MFHLLDIQETKEQAKWHHKEASWQIQNVSHFT